MIVRSPLRPGVTHFGTVIGLGVLHREGNLCPLVDFGGGYTQPLDVLVLEKFNHEFREYIDTHGKIPLVLHKNGFHDDCNIDNLEWVRPVVVSKYFSHALTHAESSAASASEHGSRFAMAFNRGRAARGAGHQARSEVEADL